MLFTDILRMVFGLAVTLGLMGLAVAALRRWGPDTIRRLQGPGQERRLSVVETLVLDPARRLVLVRVDAEERLLLLGEGRLLSIHPALESPLNTSRPPEEPAP